MSFDLAAWQHGATTLIGGDNYSGDDPTLHKVARSERLGLVREIVRSWRELRIRTSCPLTAARLDELGSFTATVFEATRAGASPYREAFAIAFLEYVTARFDDEELLETAEFEMEMIRVWVDG